MKILFVSSFLPYPLFSGGHIRLFNIIKQLSKKHEITLVCEKRDYQTEKDIEEVNKFCERIITVIRKKQWSWQTILKTGFSIYPFLMVGHTNPEMQKTIKDLLRTKKFDLIHVETFYVMQNLPKNVSIPIVLAEHNVEYLVYKHFTDKAFLPIRALLYIDILKLKYWEEKYWRKVKKLVAVSEVDKKIMSGKRKDVEVVPNGVDLKKYQISNIKYQISNKEKRVLFIGDFRWVENRDATEWILKEIWPKIKADAIALLQHDARLKLWIVGRNIPSSIMKLSSDKSVIFDENAASDTAEIYQNADILLAPIRVGGGTSFKVLEAMASGVPAVTTPLGNAINAKENSEILIAETSEEFVAKIQELLENKKLYEYISSNARKLVEEKFAWEKIMGQLEEVYEAAINKAVM